MQLPKEKGHTTKNTKDRATRTSLKNAIQVNSGSSEGEAVPVPLVAPVVS
jgi:hypothetical protein